MSLDPFPNFQRASLRISRQAKNGMYSIFPCYDGMVHTWIEGPQEVIESLVLKITEQQELTYRRLKDELIQKQKQQERDQNLEREREAMAVAVSIGAQRDRSETEFQSNQAGEDEKPMPLKQLLQVGETQIDPKEVRSIQFGDEEGNRFTIVAENGAKIVSQPSNQSVPTREHEDARIFPRS